MITQGTVTGVASPVAGGSLIASGTGCAGTTSSCTTSVGTTVTLTETPSTGYTFSGWSQVTCLVTSTTCSVLVATGTQTVTASYTKTPVTITYSAGPNGTISSASDTGVACSGTPSGGTCTGVYGDTIALTAAPNANYHLTSWTGGAGCSGKTTTTCTFTATGSESDTANFAITTVSVSVAANGPGTVSAVDAQNPSACATAPGGATATCASVNAGDNIAVTATANPPYALLTWSGTSCNGKTTTTCTFTAPTTNDAETANFGAPTSVVYVAQGGSAGPSCGGTANPCATPNEGLSVAESSGGTKSQIWIAGGSYPGPMTLTAADDGFTILGRSATASGTTITGSPEGLLANGASGITIESITFAGQAPSGSSSSAYGIRALSGSFLTLSNVLVSSGNGSAGNSGAAGTSGVPGGAGGAGGAGQAPAQVAAACLASNGTRCAPVDGSGGHAGVGVNGNDYFVMFNAAYEKNPLLQALVLSLPSPAAGPSAGDGGFGGYGNTHSTATLQGCTGKGSSLACGPERIVKKRPQVVGTYYGGWGSTPASAPYATEGGGGKPGYANLSGDGFPGSNGTDAQNGASGANGAPGSSSSPAGSVWTPGNGTDGSTGGPGAGGGGGGGGGGNIAIATAAAAAAGSGNGGGGGGGGGSGGSGGSGGDGGGGSFGVYLDGGSSVTIAGGAVTAGNGGAGGNGGQGGSGGAGGAGGAGGTNGVPEEGAGGNGGNGGDGGPGGGGGGGAGGPSIAIYAADSSSTSQVASGTPLNAGSGGPGGQSGALGSAPQLAPAGASAACLGNCRSIKNLPLVLPALGLVHNGSVVTQIECEAACAGSGSLQLLGAGGVKFGQFSFRRGAKGLATLHMTLNRAARAHFSRAKSLLVELSVTASVAGGGRNTYVTMLDLARTPPRRSNHKPKHK